MGSSVKLILAILLISFFGLYILYYYLIFPKVMIYRLKKIKIDENALHKHIGNGLAAKQTPNDFLDELRPPLTILKSAEYGIAYRRHDNVITMLNNSVKAEDISFDTNKSRLHHNNKLFEFLNNALLSKKECAHMVSGQYILIVRNIGNDKDCLVFVKYPSLSNSIKRKSD